jgi:hypothetical protein
LRSSSLPCPILPPGASKWTIPRVASRRLTKMAAGWCSLTNSQTGRSRRRSTSR